jgi:hypothetical protein
MPSGQLAFASLGMARFFLEHDADANAVSENGAVAHSWVERGMRIALNGTLVGRFRKTVEGFERLACELVVQRHLLQII